MKARRLTSTAVGVALALAACGGQDSTPDEAAAVVTVQEPVTETAVEPDGDTTQDAPHVADQEPVTETAVDQGVVDSGVVTSETTPADVAVVPAALQFSAPLVGGGELDAAGLADKPTVFWFWAPT